jgi:hypothetical protein
MDKPLYKPFKSKAKNKKYSVYVMKNGKKKLINFGDTRYQHFKDKIGDYSNLDHNDKKRQKSYLSRAKGIKDKQGNLTWRDKNSANYYAVKYLWGG